MGITLKESVQPKTLRPPFNLTLSSVGGIAPQSGQYNSIAQTVMANSHCISCTSFLQGFRSTRSSLPLGNDERVVCTASFASRKERGELKKALRGPLRAL